MLDSVSEPTIKLTKAPNSDTAAQEKPVGWASTGGGQASRARPPAQRWRLRSSPARADPSAARTARNEGCQPAR